jgi:hypothetical protein
MASCLIRTSEKSPNIRSDSASIAWLPAPPNPTLVRCVNSASSIGACAVNSDNETITRNWRIRGLQRFFAAIATA